MGSVLYNNLAFYHVCTRGNQSATYAEGAILAAQRDHTANMAQAVALNNKAVIELK